MPQWPREQKKQPGGFDLAVRFEGDTSYSLVAELKWTHYGFVNALDEAPWDAFITPVQVSESGCDRSWMRA